MDNPYPICENCIFADVPSGKDPCRECSNEFLAQRIKPNFVRKVRKRKPITNADRIRSMTDDELASFFRDYVACDDCPAQQKKCGRVWIPCKDVALSWLKKEVKDE